MLRFHYQNMSCTYSSVQLYGTFAVNELYKLTFKITPFQSRVSAGRPNISRILGVVMDAHLSRTSLFLLTAIMLMPAAGTA
jgi:hypothetical protein